MLWRLSFALVSAPLPSGVPNPAFNNQPWFENQLPGLGIGCGPIKDPVTMKGNNISSTACLASGNSANFINNNVSSLFNSIDGDRFGLGLHLL